MATEDASTPRFSVLIPTHNEATLVALAIRSVLAQTRQSFEILLVADGCTDGTQETVRSIGDPRIRLFDLPKAPGFGYANRNVALKRSRGELIAFLAHDDLYLPDHLETMEQVFEDPSVQWACSRPMIVESDGSAHPSPQNLNVPAQLQRFCDRVSTVPACNVVYRRTCHERSGFWDESFEKAGDREFWARLIMDAGVEAIRFVPEVTALHFRAPWRENLRAPGPVSRGFKYPYPDPWPLQVELNGNPVEQEPYLDAMTRDPVGWTSKFRRDSQAVLDGRLWEFDALRVRRRKKRWEERRLEKKRNETERPRGGILRRIFDGIKERGDRS